jgi:predicted HicB family RNase H-like nuclease
MTINKSEFYTYRITWSEEDGEHIGLCVEFPSLSYLDKDMVKSLKGIQKLVSDVIADMKKNKEEVPEPLSKKEFSGKFIIRLTPEKHRELAIRALEQGVSLNRYACSKLAGL